MKKFVIIAAASAIFWACEEQKTPLEKLYHERDSLVEVQNGVSDRLRQLEEEILAQDSTRKLTTITAMPLSTAPFDHYFEVYGTVEASKSISVYPESSGLIKRIVVKEGQKVAAGQLLAELDDNVLQKSIAEVKTSLELATTLYEKQRKLWIDEKIGSEVQYLQAKNNKESLESRLATLNQQVRMTQVRAPFSGVIDDIFPKEGEMANPGMAVLRLVNLSEVYITADVSEAYVGTIKAGTKAEVYISTLDDSFESEVVQVGQFINPANRTFKVQIAITENSNAFKPNMMASIRLNDYHASSAITIPNSLIQQTPTGENFVYVVESVKDGFGKIKRIMVTTGMSYQDVTEIKEGLTPESILVNKGSRSVQNEQHVRIVEG